MTINETMPGTKIDRVINFLGWAILGLVSLITLGSFVLSYNALRQVVLAYGYSPMLSYIWPLLLDASLVVFSLAAVRANVLKENRWLPTLFVLLYAASTVFFNILHAPLEPTAGLINLALASSVPTNILVYAIPPISLLLSFELLMLSFRSIADRTLFVESLQDMKVRGQDIEHGISMKKDDLESRTSDAEAQLETLWHRVQEEKLQLKRAQKKTAHERMIGQEVSLRLQQERLDKIAELSPTRGEIFNLLTEEPFLSIEDVSERSGLATQTVSIHVQSLKDAGLVNNVEETHEG